MAGKRKGGEMTFILKDQIDNAKKDGEMLVASGMNANQLREIFSHLKVLEKKPKEILEVELKLLIARIYYKVGRKVIPSSICDWLCKIFQGADKKVSVSNFSDCVKYMEAVVAYYYAKRAEQGGVQ